MRSSPGSTDDEGMMVPMPSFNPKRVESKRAAEGLLEHFHQFAKKIHAASEQDVKSIQAELDEITGSVEDVLDREVKDREKGDAVLAKRCDALERSLAALQKEHAERGSHRLDELETTFASWADKHTRDVGALRKQNDVFRRDLAGLSEAHEQHLEVEESLDTAVKGLTSAAEQTAKALAAAKAKLDHMHADVAGCEQRCASAEARGGAHAERLADVERRLQGGLEGCSRQLEAVRTDQHNHAAQVKQQLAETHELINQHSASHQESLNAAVKSLASHGEENAKALAAARARLEQLHEAAAAGEHRSAAADMRSAALAEKLREAERRLEGNVNNFHKDIEHLKNDHSDLSNQVKKKFGETHDLIHGHAASHKESLDQAVKKLSSSADETAKALEEARQRADRAHESAQGCEQRCGTAERRAAELTERLHAAERRLDATAVHAKDLQSLRDDHGALANQVKHKLGEATDLIHTHVGSHKARLDSHEQAHSALTVKHEGQVRDLKSLRDDHDKHGQELGHLRRHVDGALGELATNTGAELKATRDELDQVLLLLAGVQRAWRPNNGGRRRSKRPTEEAATPKTPKTPNVNLDMSMDMTEVNVDLLRHGAEGRAHLL